MTEISSFKNVLQYKHEKLENAKTVLKKEFVGINKVIDRVIESLSSWYMFPGLQETPLIINLWGMTGVGKSSLVNRLADLLGYKKQHYRFDMGELSSKSNMNVIDQLTGLALKKESEPFIISFDEFQHAKTIDEDKREIQKAENRIIWKILDTGTFDADTASSINLRRLSWIISKTEYAINYGVKAAKGIVVKNVNEFISINNFSELANPTDKERKEVFAKYKNKQVRLIEEDFYDDIYDAASDIFNSPIEVETKLLLCNEKETLTLLKKCLRACMQPKTIDCRQSLVFIIGNLDEAYTMNSNYSPEMSADEFHELSLKISLPRIKNALRNRFRSEQIARLGNNHIIYPAFNCYDYRQLVKMELDRIRAKIWKEYDIHIEFNQSIENILYEEGVYPTQGTRPLFSTIQQTIMSKLPGIFAEMAIKNIDADKLSISYKDNILEINCYSKNKIVFTIQKPHEFELKKLRKNRKDDQQAISAVHESGHAVLSITLLNTIPSVIYSITSDNDNEGFVYTKLNRGYMSKSELLPRVAMLLGGYTAEKLIFGEDYLTSGANTDIERATTFVSRMLKTQGMGDAPVLYATSQNDPRENYHAIHEIEAQIKKTIQEGEKLACHALEKEKTLLLEISRFLSNNRMVEKAKIKKFIKHYGSSSIHIEEDHKNNYYREKLEETFREHRSKEIKLLDPANYITMNRKKMDS